MLAGVSFVHSKSNMFSFFSKANSEDKSKEPGTEPPSPVGKGDSSNIFIKVKELWDIDDYCRRILQDLGTMDSSISADEVAARKVGAETSVTVQNSGIVKSSTSEGSRSVDKSMAELLAGLDGGVKSFISEIASRTSRPKADPLNTTTIDVSVETARKADILDIVPSSVLDERSKGTLRVLSALGDKLISQFQRSTQQLQHPFLINVGILRLYILQTTPSLRPILRQGAEKAGSATISQHFLAEARHFLRYAAEVYAETPPYVADEDVLLNSLHEHYSHVGKNVKIPRHIVFLDHLTKSIVVSIRGTGSISDILTDLHYDAKPLPPPPKESAMDSMLGRLTGDSSDPAKGVIYAHSGITDSAIALQPSVTKAILGALDSYADYSIVFTGHSLGAGTACLLSTLIARDSELTIKTFAFAPPPVISRNGATDFKRSLISGKSGKCSVYSFVHDNDVIPRASHNEFLNMLSAISCIDSLPWSPKDRTMKLLQGYLTDNEIAQIQMSFKNETSAFREQDGVELVIPGEIFWLIPKSEDESSALSGSAAAPKSVKYEIVTIRNPTALFNGSFLTGDSMVSDHQVASYLTAMRSLDTSSSREVR